MTKRSDRAMVESLGAKAHVSQLSSSYQAMTGECKVGEMRWVGVVVGDEMWLSL